VLSPPEAKRVNTHHVPYIFYFYALKKCDEWVLVTKAWRFLRLRMEERHPIWRIAPNILNKQSRTTDKGWPSSFEVGEVLTIPHRKNVSCCETVK
jgi:hypothetical protein